MTLRQIMASSLCCGILFSLCSFDNQVLAKEEKAAKNKKTESVFNDDSLLGGVNFVKGMKGSKLTKNKDIDQIDQVEGEVVVTTNPYNSVPKPTGILFGNVYEPNKDGKPQKPKNNNMLTGLALILGAMNANNAGN